MPLCDPVCLFGVTKRVYQELTNLIEGEASSLCLTTVTESHVFIISWDLTHQDIQESPKDQRLPRCIHSPVSNSREHGDEDKSYNYF